MKFSKFFKNLIGVEIDTIEYNNSLILLKDFKNIQLINSSIEKINFNNNNNVLFYMYEPLWDEKDCHIRYNIYNNIINNLCNKTQRCNRNYYILYISANSFDKCNFNLNKTNKLKIIDNNNSNLWPFSRNIFLYKLI